MKRFAALLLLAGPLARAADARQEFARGVLEKSRGLATAEEHFEAARLADPTALPLVRRAVAARMARGDRAAAVKLYRDLSAARPGELAVQIGYADFLTAQAGGDSLALALAKDALEAALRENPGHPEVVRRLFDLAGQAENRQRQLDLIGMLSTSDPESVLLAAALSRKLFAADDAAAREKLDRTFREAAAARPGAPDLARAASDHFHDTGRPEEAISILERHVAAAPASLGLRTRLGVLYFEAKRDAEGKAALEAVLEIDPRQALAHQALAKYHRLRGDATEARMHAGEVLKLRGGSPDDFAKLAGEWLDAGDPREARLLLERAIFNHPGDHDLACRLAIATRRDPETRQLAPRLFREAEAMRPPDSKPAPAFLMESAEAMLDSGRTKAAEERLRVAIRAYPPEAKKETAAALRRLAGIWERENRNGDAARALRQRADALER